MPLIEKIRGAHAAIRDDFLYREYPAAGQRALADELMTLMGIDRRHCGLGETLHPFTITFNNKDVRITTNYDERNLASSLYSVVHEGGHALYELNTADEFEGHMPRGRRLHGDSCQSRLFEKRHRRSRAFVSVVYRKCREIFPEQLRDVTEEELSTADSHRGRRTCVPVMYMCRVSEKCISSGCQRDFGEPAYPSCTCAA